MSQNGKSTSTSKTKVSTSKATTASIEFNDIDILQVMQGTIVSVVITNVKGEIQFFNKAAEKLWGYKSSEVIGKNVKVLTPPEIQKEHDQYLERYSKTGKRNVMGGSREVKAMTKDGELVDILLSLSEAETNGEKVYTSFIFNITDKKKLEQDIQEQIEEMSAQEEELRQNMEEMTATQEEMARRQVEMDGQISAINSTSAFIEFKPDGTIIKANEIFLKALKYDLNEIVGEHHKIFCEKEYVNSIQYEKFWRDLGKGIPQTGEFKRIASDGSEVWILANYTPVIDDGGSVIKVIKLATDITKTKLENANYEGQLDAINKSQAVIEFTLGGEVIKANDNFLQTVGYTLDEIEGKHHSMFVTNEIKNSEAYQKFWSELRNGQYQAGEFKRLNKQGNEVWLQASYNPIMDLNGQPYKIVKYASNISAQKKAEKQAETERIRNFKTLEQAVDSVITINSNKEITFINPAAERMFGFSSDEVIGQNVKVLVPMEHRGNHDRYVDSNLKTGEKKVIGLGRDLEMSRKDGSRFWGNLSLSKVEVDGEIQYTAFIKDITQTKHNEFAYEKVISAITKINEGDFEFNIDLSGLNVQESVQNVVSDMANLRNNLKAIISEVNHVVKEAGEEGNLNARLKLDETKGSWKSLTDSINILLQNIAEPVLEFNTIISKMSQGDLSQSFQMNTKGDLKNMADSLNTAIDNLNVLIKSIELNSSIVAETSRLSLDKSDSMKNNTNEMASAIAQMAKGAQDQAQRTDESAILVEGVLKSAGEMESKSGVIYSAAEKGVKSCDEGLSIINKLVANMNEIDTSAGLTSESIKILTNRAEEIGRTLNVITDIAAQTNLLALNAAIEAARAGDAGRGFAVVAEEIRKLAEDSRKSAVDIEKIITDVQKDTNSASKAIETMTSNVKDGSGATLNAERIFREIAESNEETLNLSKEIKEASGTQRNSIDSVSKNIEQIVVVAEETAAGTEELATSSQELNNSMEEVAKSSNKLTNVAKDLENGVNKFKLK
ncbi:PAS domain S-box protein [Mangrovivirga sp. M17]|uniref:PAS domain S-box protein n=1 Tax=Mangrovivirga halotolerans TaxID=2993936 RepID=A0ABT3RN12_9BACT|nr:PAS domain S-box protein [Mangrovivirga halotolerans]MCX2743201.1 PAS domain S-box protein [Mangrovivirga halotolerans]